MKELEGRIDDVASAAAGNKQEISTDNLKRWRTAPLSFSTDSMDIAGGTLSWNENSKEWKAIFPSGLGTVVLAGTYKEDGTMIVLADSTGGHASGDVDNIQPVFSDALKGVYQEAAEVKKFTDNALSDKIAAIDNYQGVWKGAAQDIARKYDPEVRNRETIFYGASNFSYWTFMERDLEPYAVQNHAFGGSTDKELYYWAPYILYPYQPPFVFFQTGSNDYVASKAATDELKVQEAVAYKKKMFAEFHENLPDARFIVMSGLLLPGRKEYVDMTLDINDQLRELCNHTDYMAYIDAEALTYDRQKVAFVNGVESMFKKDQIHLTEESRIRWAKNWILPELEALGAPLKRGTVPCSIF